MPDYVLECTGYELLDGLFDKSILLAEAYDGSKWVKERGLDENWDKNDSPIVKFEKQDFIEDYQDWAEGDIIFANATCFEPDMLEKVSLIVDLHFTKGQVFILTTKELDLKEEKFHIEGPF